MQRPAVQPPSIAGLKSLNREPRNICYKCCDIQCLEDGRRMMVDESCGAGRNTGPGCSARLSSARVRLYLQSGRGSSAGQTRPPARPHRIQSGRALYRQLFGVSLHFTQFKIWCNQTYIHWLIFVRSVWMLTGLQTRGWGRDVDLWTAGGGGGLVRLPRHRLPLPARPPRRLPPLPRHPLGGVHLPQAVSAVETPGTVVQNCR